MRNDVIVRTTGSIRLPEIPLGSPGRKTHAERGDFIRFDMAGTTELGRVIGWTTVPTAGTDLNGKPFLTEQVNLVVAMLLLGTRCERWILPEHVFDCQSGGPSEFSTGNIFFEKMQWFWGPAFLETPPDKARQCFELLVKDMVEPKPPQPRPAPPSYRPLAATLIEYLDVLGQSRDGMMLGITAKMDNLHRELARLDAEAAK